MFETGLPESRQDIIASFTRVQAEGEWWLGELPAQVFFTPHEQKWSPAEQALHLTKSLVPLGYGLRLFRFLPSRIYPARTKRSYGEMRDTYQARLAEGARAGRFAPSRMTMPADPESERKKILRRWRKASVSLLAGTKPWSEADLDLSALPHPILGRLSVREMLFFTVFHHSHHLKLTASRLRQFCAQDPPER